MTQDVIDEFLDAAFWKDSTDAADAILAKHPEVATASIHTAATLGDDATVRQFIERDAASATLNDGATGWDPLTHLCFSTYLAVDRSRSEGFVRAARALLDAGADPNTGFFAPDHRPEPTVESVLYGAAGIAHDPELTRLLVERGADPNHGEVAYHAPETLDNRAMKVLVESGKLTPDTFALMLARKFDWHDDEGVAWLLANGADPNHLGRWGGRPMHHALGRGVPLSYFELLLKHGADPTLAAPAGPSIFAAAARKGRADVLDLFERRGFAPVLDPEDALLAACARGDDRATREIVESNPGIIERIQLNNPALVADFADNAVALRLLLELGFDVAAAQTEPPWSKGTTALHEAVWHGRLESVKLLIAQNAPLEATHVSGRTPLDVAFMSFVEQSEWTPNESTIPIAHALIDAGARINPDHLTLAAALCLDRTDDIARLSSDATAEDKQVALSAVAYNGKVEGIRTVLGLGIDVNQYNAGLLPTATPLHSAVNAGSLDAVKALVEAGARLDTRDTAYQSTPVDWAEWYAREAAKGSEARQYAEIAAYLRGEASKSRA